MKKQSMIAKKMFTKMQLKIKMKKKKKKFAMIGSTSYIGQKSNSPMIISKQYRTAPKKLESPSIWWPNDTKEKHTKPIITMKSMTTNLAGDPNRYAAFLVPLSNSTCCSIPNAAAVITAMPLLQ